MTLRKKKLLDLIPEKCTELVTVTWSKGASLDKIAKKYGLKSGQEVWRHALNKELVKKRKTPAGLLPGDVLVIPFRKEALKRLNAAVEHYNKSKRAYVAYAELLEHRIQTAEKRIAALYDLVDQVQRRKFDGANQRKIVEALVAGSAMLQNAVDAIQKTKIPTGLPPIDLKPTTAALKRVRTTMAGGTLDDARLKGLRAQIDRARAEIAGLNKEIARIDRDLDKTGSQTIGAFCTEKTLQKVLPALMKTLSGA